VITSQPTSDLQALSWEGFLRYQDRILDDIIVDKTAINGIRAIRPFEACGFSSHPV
jgi:hypothetical protein